MPFYPYQCPKGHYIEIDKAIKDCSQIEHCKVCGEILNRLYTAPQITGTRDNFGVTKEFYSPHAKKYINNWKDWGKAGYKDPKNDPTMTHTLKEKVKEKMDKIKFYKSRGEDPTGKAGMPGD